MKLRGLGFLVLCVPGVAAAGGLFLPGAGAVSTSRAGAAVASADDGEALAINPAGLAKAKGNTVTVSAAMISYAMQFTRRGMYDDVPMEAYPYEGQPFPTMKNDASPPLGIGSVQPVPVIAFVTDLGTEFGGHVPGLHVAVGLYAPNAYPFRDMCTQLPTGGCQKYVFNGDFNIPPPVTRYDIMSQDAAVILPSLGVAYSILPELDVGGRLSVGNATLKSKTAIWGIPGNYEEDVKKDGQFEVDASDYFVPAFGLGVTYRPTPNIELGLNYSSQIDIHASGNAHAVNGPSVNINGTVPTIEPPDPQNARCAKGGTIDTLKACVDLELPMNVQIGGRYKFLDNAGNTKADIELDLDWENWGKSCSSDEELRGSCTSPSDYHVVVDAMAVVNGDRDRGLPLEDSLIRHGLQDTYAARLGGSYHIGISEPRSDKTRDEVIIRGGVGYDTTAAKTGFLRADLDGAARTTVTLGAAYRTEHFEIDIGGGAILEGSTSNPNVGGGAMPCNPTASMLGCTGSGTETPVDQRHELDPINPLVNANNTFQSPVNQGDFKSHYTLFMLGFSTWF